MIVITQAQLYRALRARLVDALALPESRVYLTNEPRFTEAMDFVVQISPLAAGATNEMNRTGLGFVTERFAVTTFVRTASDNDIKQSRQLAGEDHGVIERQGAIRSALIQNELGGILQVPIRFVSSGPVRLEPRAQLHLSATDVFVCSYALAWPVAGAMKFGYSATQPAWGDLPSESFHNGSLNFTTSVNRSGASSAYAWFLIPQDIHARGVTFRTAQGIEPFYHSGFLPPSGPATGTVVQDGVTYYRYRRAYPTTATSLSYRLEIG